MLEHDVVLMAGRNADPFAQEVAASLGLPLHPVRFTEFADDGGAMSGETKVEILDNIRGRDVCILWSVGYTNYELVGLLQLIDAARLSSGARAITLVCPEFPCARQDKTHERRESLTSRLVARLLETAGLDSVLTLDLHSDQIEGHFRIPLDHLRSRPIWGDYIGRRYREWQATCGLAPDGADLVLGVPDAGRARAVRELSEEVALHLRSEPPRPKLRLAHHDKHRAWDDVGRIQSHGLLGPVKGRVVWFTDDLLSSGATLFAAAEAAREAGARHVLCGVTHAHGYDRGTEEFAARLEASAIDELVVTDTHPRFLARVRADPRLAARTTVLSLTPLFARAIRRIRGGQTIKEMMRQETNFGALYRVVHAATSAPHP